MPSVAKLVKKLRDTACPKCEKKTLIPRYPRRSNAVRCLNCGMLGRIN